MKHFRTPTAGSGTLRSFFALTLTVLVLAATFSPLVPDAAGDPSASAAPGVTLNPSPSATPGEVSAGGSVDVTVELPSPTPSSTSTATVAITGPATLKPTSVRTPTSWDATFSSSGPTGPFDAPLSSATNAFSLTGEASTPSGATGSAAPPMPGVNMVTSTGSGAAHGWVPVHVGERIFNVMHHSKSGDREINCSDRRTGALCPGYPKELLISAVDDLRTPFTIEPYVDGDARLWFAASRDLPGTADEAGFFCFDTRTDAPCLQRWFPLAQVTVGAAPVGENQSPVSTIGAAGGRVYMASMRAGAPTVAQRVSVSCFDTTTLTGCGRSDLGSSTTPSWEYPDPSVRAPWLLSHQVGSRMFFVLDYGHAEVEYFLFNGAPSRLMCFDAATSAMCTGWSIPAIDATSSGSGAIRGVSALFDNPADPAGVCLFVSRVTPQLIFSTSGPVVVPTVAARTPLCYGTTGAATVAPAGLAALVNSVPVRVGAANSGTQEPVVVTHVAAQRGARLYIPFSAREAGAGATMSNSWMLCFDLAAGQRCAGFGTNGLLALNAGGRGVLTAYGTTLDAAGCLWTIGGTHEGWMFSLDAMSGELPCATSTVSVPVSVPNHYCGTTPAGASYDQVFAAGASSLAVTVRTPAGVAVPGFENLTAAGSTLDISSLPAGSPYIVEVTPRYSDPAVAATPPPVEVTFDGPPARLCFTLDVEGSCAAAGDLITVAVTADDGTGPSTETSSVLVTPITACTTSTTSTTTPPGPPATTPPPSSTAPPPSPPPTTPSPSTPSPSTPTLSTSPAPGPPTPARSGATPGGVVDARAVNADAAAQTRRVGSLPRTGSSSATLVTAAACAVFGGVVLRRARRRS